MIDRKLVLILILLICYVFWVRPLKQNAQPEFSEIKTIQKSIAKKKFIAKHQNEIKKSYKRNQRIIHQNEALLFSEDTSLTNDRSKLQQVLKGMLISSGLTVVRINWGEVVKKKGYDALPLSFIARGTPDQLENLFIRIQKSRKLLRFYQITISKYRKKRLLIEAIIMGYKKEKG